jgi:peroxiredoxin
MKITSLCLLLLLAFPALVASQSFAPQDDTESYTRVGDKMPAFTITDLNGREISTANLKGKVMLVNFWATWCPPCRAEMPRLEKEVWQKYRDSEFVMVAIAREQSEEEIAEFQKENRLSFPFAADPQREVYKRFGNGGIPRSYVVGVDGKILYQSVGYLPSEFDQMKKVIEKELAKAQKAKAGK